MSDSTLGLSTGRLVRNTVARTVGSVFTLIAGAGTGLVVARHLGPQGYGSFAFVWAIAWAVVTVVPLGFESLLVRELNRRPRLLDLRRAMPAVVVTGVIVAGGMIVAGFLFASERPLALALAAGAIYVLASGPRSLIRAVFDAVERMELTAATDVIEAVATLGTVIVLAIADAGLVAISIGVAGTRVASLVVTLVMLRRWVQPEPTDPAESPRRRLSTLLRASLPMAGSRVAGELLRRLDVLILGLLVAPREIGWYVAAATIALYAPVVLMELNRALYPVLSRAESHQDRDLLRLFGFTWRAHLMLGTVAAAGLAVVGGPIVVLLYGEAYAPAGPLLVILAWTIPLRTVSALCAVTLDATYRQGRRLRASGFAVAVNLVLNGLLIPVIGVWGAAVAALATETVFLIACVRALRPHRPQLVMPLLWSVLVAAPVALAAALTPGPGLARVAAGAAVFGLLSAGFLWRRWRASPADTDLATVVRQLAGPTGEGTP